MYHDTSLAFFTGHFAANSKGRNRLAARLSDSRDTLSKAVLTTDDIGFDCHLTHHHTFIFGDLNYRCTSSPETVLGLVAEASRLERDLVWGGSADWRRLAYEETARRHPCRPKQLPSAVKIAWNKVLACDELQLVMNESEVFHDFLEPGDGRPAFPPSFRRKMGEAGFCGDYTDAEILQKAYTTTVLEKARSAADNAAAAKEDAAKEAAAKEDEESKSLDSRASRVTATSRSMAAVLKPGERIPSYTDRVLYHTLPDRRGDIVPGPYEVCDQAAASDHRAVSATFQIRVDPRVVRGHGGDKTGAKCMLRVKASELSRRGEWAGAGRAEPAEVVMVFPLPTEDPLVEERRLQEVATALFTGDAAENDAQYTNGDGSETVVVNERDVLNCASRGAWSDCSSDCVDGGGGALQIISDCR